MGAAEDLAEVAALAARAETLARSSAWQDRASIAAARTVLDAALRDGGDPGRAGYGAEPAPEAGDAAALLAEAPGSAAGDAIAAARIALLVAARAVLSERLAEIDAAHEIDAAGALDGAEYPGAARRPGRGARGGASLRPGMKPALHHARSLTRGVWEELVHIVRDRPRDVAFRLGISLGLGLAYLGFLRLFRWDVTEPELPFIALYALSGVAGSVVVTNSMSVDAGRVRTMLTSGHRLGHVMVTKNLAIIGLVGVAGLLLSAVVIIRTGDTTAFVKACGQLFAMIFIWIGVGNVLTVVSPLRAEPIGARRHDGTLRPFLLSFAISYGLGYLVNFMLYWRVWAKTTLMERLGGAAFPVLLIIASAAALWALLTVLALSLAQQPAVRRRMLRELIDYRQAKAGTTTAGEPPMGGPPAVAGTAGEPPTGDPPTGPSMAGEPPTDGPPTGQSRTAHVVGSDTGPAEP